MSALVRLVLLLALLGALAAGEQYVEGIGYDRRATEDAETISAQKEEATALRQRLENQRIENEAALKEFKTQLETTREDLRTKNAADLRGRLAGPSLRYTTLAPTTECGRSGGSPQGAASSPASDPGTAVVQLPDRISGDLFALLGKAEELKIDYAVLHAYVHNPKLVCELQP